MKRGCLITILVVVVVLLALFIVGGFIYMQFTAEPYVPEQGYLQINLGGPLPDSATPSFPKLGAQPVSVRDLWYQLERARVDRRVKGVAVKIAYLQCGFAKIEEIGRLLQSFKQSQKPVLAYIEDGGLHDYYLASFADKVLVNQGSMLTLNGIAAEAMFLKNTLNKLGVKPEIFHIGDYKTAANTFTEDHMTPAHRESYSVLLADISNAIVDGIARNRKLDRNAVQRVLNESPLPAERYLREKWFDALCYEDQITSYFKSEYSRIDFKTYCKTTAPEPFSGPNQIAVIFAGGEINSGASGGQSLFGGDVLGSDTVARELAQVRKSSAIKAVVLRIDSPGGSAVASDVMLREAQLLADKKPLVISMSDLAASGGYWLAMAGARILAQPETLTGSIGVVHGKFVLKGLYDTIGVTKEMIRTTPNAGMYSDYEAFTPQEKEKVIAAMNGVYDQFLEKVAKNRKKTKAEVDKIGQGRVWSGSAALRLNLIDALGGLPEAIAEARKLAKLPANENIGIRMYPVKKDLWDLILELGDVEVKSPVDIEAKLKPYAHFFPALISPYQINLR
jgi:protease IV